MSETIGPLAAGRRRRPSTMRRATAPVRTPSVTFTASAAFCRSMPTAAITDDAGRPQGAITPALCWAHARRQFFELADIATNPRRGKNAVVISPIALEAVRRIDALFEIERVINGRSTAERLEVRREQSTRLVADLEVWLRDQRSRLSRSASVAEPIDYMLRRWPSFARFLDDGPRACLQPQPVASCSPITAAGAGRRAAPDAAAGLVAAGPAGGEPARQALSGLGFDGVSDDRTRCV